MSSAISQIPFFSQKRTSSATKASGAIAPQGLFGLLRMIAFVEDETTRSTSAKRGVNDPSSGFTITGTAPTILMISG